MLAQAMKPKVLSNSIAEPSEIFEMTYVFLITPIYVHLTQAVVRQDEAGRGVLRGLVIILKGLGVVLLNVVSTSHLVAGLRSHRLVLRVVKGVKAQVLNFGKVLKADKQNTINGKWVGGGGQWIRGTAHNKQFIYSHNTKVKC